MCYICRQELGGKEGGGGGGGGRGGGDDSGYAHFCQHFRERPGMRCRQCEKCDLYAGEDEEGVIRQAARDAEREWVESQAETRAANGDIAGCRVESGVSESKRVGRASWIGMEMGKEGYADVIDEVVYGRKRSRVIDWDKMLEGLVEVLIA